MLIMVCYFKRICGINQAEDRVKWPDLLHRHTIALASFREWSVVSAWLRIRAQPWNPCQPRNSASASTWSGGGRSYIFRTLNSVPFFLDMSQYHQICTLSGLFRTCQAPGLAAEVYPIAYLVHFCILSPRTLDIIAQCTRSYARSRSAGESLPVNHGVSTGAWYYIWLLRNWKLY